jgi:hypothetical protein
LGKGGVGLDGLAHEEQVWAKGQEKLQSINLRSKSNSHLRHLLLFWETFRDIFNR